MLIQLSFLAVLLAGGICQSILSFPGFFNNEELANSIEESPPEVNEYASVSEQQFTEMKIEYIKQQILRKLRLKEKPNISGSELPTPIKEYEHLLPDPDENLESSYSDDYYGKTTQAIIFPSEVKGMCGGKREKFPSACLPFQMPSADDIHTTDVSKAELWFHKEKDLKDPFNQTFVISELAHWDDNKSFPKDKPVAIEETNLKEGWVKVDLTYLVKNWLSYQNSPKHAIKIVCKTCGIVTDHSPISFSTNLKPFLVIYTHSQERRNLHHRRQKRSLPCGPGVNECCKENLYISFEQIGWSDWIFKPEGYNAYFCKGSCNTATSLTLSAHTHNSIMQKIMTSNSRPEYTPCCAATQFLPLQLVYRTGNNSVTTKRLSNMIVDSCGCM